MKLTIVTFLLIASNHLIGQDDEIYFVNVDSVITCSFFGKRSTDLADSLYQHHRERLSKEVVLFQEKVVYYIHRYEECCSCTTKEITAKMKELNPVQEELEKQENHLNRLKELIIGDYKAIASTIIIELTARYATGNSIQSLIIDSSSAQIFPNTTSSSYFLTEEIVQLLESDTLLKPRVNKLEQTIIETVNKDFETK